MRFQLGGLRRQNFLCSLVPAVKLGIRNFQRVRPGIINSFGLLPFFSRHHQPGSGGRRGGTGEQAAGDFRQLGHRNDFDDGHIFRAAGQHPAVGPAIRLAQCDPRLGRAVADMTVAGRAVEIQRPATGNRKSGARVPDEPVLEFDPDHLRRNAVGSGLDHDVLGELQTVEFFRAGFRGGLRAGVGNRRRPVMADEFPDFRLRNLSRLTAVSTGTALSSSTR